MERRIETPLRCPVDRTGIIGRAIFELSPGLERSPQKFAARVRGRCCACQRQTASWNCAPDQPVGFEMAQHDDRRRHNVSQRLFLDVPPHPLLDQVANGFGR